MATNEYERLINDINSAKRQAQDDKEKAYERARKHADDIAGICAVARACLESDGLVQLRKANGQNRVIHGGFLPGDTNDLTIMLDYGILQGDAMRQVSGVWHEVDDKGRGVLISTDGSVYQHGLSSKDIARVTNDMLDRLPSLKNDLFEYVRRQIGEAREK